MNKIYDCLIIGAGPCGIGAAEVLTKAQKDIAIIEMSTPGGKVNVAPRVDNYPHQESISGPDLAVKFFNRINDAKIPLIGDEIIDIDKQDNLFVLSGKNTKYTAKTVLIGSGTKERVLGLPKEKELFAKGISYCAICDGHFFKNKDVIVIGGGNTALKEALYLSEIVNKLYVIHRRNEFRGSVKLVEELKSHSNVSIMTPFIPLEFIGEEKLEAIRIANKETNEERIIKVDGAFPLVGQLPNSGFVSKLNITNEWGTIPVDKAFMTSVDGVFAGGDILPRDIRQIYLAEHDGVTAANSIIKYLEA